MASFFTLILDTIGPQGVTLSINSGATHTSSANVTLTIGTSDTDKTGYQMKIWGISGIATESAAAWETYTASKAVALIAGDGSKTVSIRLRDNVLNESAVVTDSITLDTAVPTCDAIGPDVIEISTISPANKSIFTFTTSEIYKAYKVKIVPTTTSIESAGTQIPTAGGSTNVSGTNAAGFPAATPITVTVCGADVAAVSAANGGKIIKVFVQDMAGTWSVV